MRDDRVCAPGEASFGEEAGEAREADRGCMHGACLDEEVGRASEAASMVRGLEGEEDMEASSGSGARGDEAAWVGEQACAGHAWGERQGR